MNPHSKHRPLFFTPRSPWGGRLESHSFRRHMRASEDRKPDPTSKEMQGLTGQMAPNLPGGSSGQSGGNGGNVWKIPHYEPAPSKGPQTAAASSPNFRTPKTGEAYHESTSEPAKAGGNFFMGGEGTQARGEPLDANVWVGYNTNKSQPVAPFDQKEANDDFIRRSWGQKPFEKD